MELFFWRYIFRQRLGVNIFYSGVFLTLSEWIEEFRSLAIHETPWLHNMILLRYDSERHGCIGDHKIVHRRGVEDRRSSDAEINKKVDSIMRGSFKTAAIVGSIGALLITGAGMLFQYFINQSKPTNPTQPQIIINVDSIKNAKTPDSTVNLK